MCFELGERDQHTDFPSVWTSLVPRTLILPMERRLGRAVKRWCWFLTRHLVTSFREVAAIFPFSNCPRSVSSYYAGEKGSYILPSQSSSEKKQEEWGVWTLFKLEDKIDWNVFHSWLFREWPLMTLKYCKSFNIKSMPGHGPAFRRQLILWRIHTAVSSSCWSSQPSSPGMQCW